MERRHFVPLNKRVGLAIAAVALLAVGACTQAEPFRGREVPATVTTAGTESQATFRQNLIETGQWSYMPGTEQKPDGLHVMYRGFKIVQQDGSGGQPNPPVNEYGTYLKVPDNFTVRADLADFQGDASLQFYARPPIVSDEFRVEPASIRLSVSGDKLVMSRWDGRGQKNLADQQPVERKEFAIPIASEMKIEVIHKDRVLSVNVNDKPAGTFAAGDTFTGKQLWFGADAEEPGSHFTIKNLAAEGQGGTVTAIDTSNIPAYNKRSDGLQELVKKNHPKFQVGSNVALWAVTSNPKFRERIYGGDFGLTTPENALKWQFVEPQPGVFDFHEIDALVAEAKKNGMKVQGHNLVFSEALPRWVQDLPNDKEQVRQVLNRHVTELVSHFKGVIDDWEINELIADYDDNGNLTSTFRDNIFYRVLGADYIRETIRAAKAANPNARIWFNEYGMETDTGGRTRASHDLAKQLQQEGLPVYGIGHQAHIYDTKTDLIVNSTGQTPELDANLRDLQDRGMMARFSELDAPTGKYNGTSQGKQFVGVFRTCFAHQNCVGVGFWSMAITDLWQDDNHSLQSGSVDSLFDQSVNPTQGYLDVQKFLRDQN